MNSLNNAGINRQNFMRVAGAATIGMAGSLTAAEHKRTKGANERISMGLIGVGGRGLRTHMKTLHKLAESHNVEVTAICDTWRVARETAAGQAKEWFGKEPRVFTRAADLLALDDLDAVMVATPDHTHTHYLKMAAEAGKHCYIEKPMATDMDGLNAAFDAVKKSGIIVQVGTQVRSMPGSVGARKLYQTGIMGDIVRIEEKRNGARPYWIRRANKEVKREDVDWEEFVCGCSNRAFDPVVYSAWYGYYEFCQGPVPQWGVHYMDTVFYITGLGIPDSCMCHGAVTPMWQDEHKFTVPDNIMATYLYDEGFMMTTSNQFVNTWGDERTMYTNKGLLRFQDRDHPTFTAEGGKDRDGKIRGVNEVETVPGPDHWENWLECLRGGVAPNAPIEAGFQHAVCSIMASKSYETGRRMVYDPKKRRIIPG